jgi:hypothetical protein
MTETEWLNCDSPSEMIPFLVSGAQVTDRQLRLYACGCCRLAGLPSRCETFRAAIETAEAYADGGVSWTEMRDLGTELGRIWASEGDDALHSIWSVIAVTSQTGLNAAREVRAIPPADQAKLLREIVGNPFRWRYRRDEWLSYDHGLVHRFVQTVYYERDLDCLPILADALEDAGCDNAGILAHCRGPGRHVRGCWVVDLLLGKE